MAGSAKVVQRGAVESPGLDRTRLLRVAHVRRRGSVTVFAPDTEFGGHNRAILSEANGTSRVAGETAEDRSFRIENTVTHSSRPDVPRSAHIAIKLRVPTLFEFQVIPGIYAAHERDGLLPSAECPLARLRGFRAGECFGVAVADCAAYSAGWHVLHAADPA